MKKIYSLFILLNFAMISLAQNIQQVNYRGAFAPAPTPMWTDGWANWDPQTTVYPATTVTVSGTISANTTWTRNNVYQLSGLVYVDTLITLTIEPGTIIRGGPTTSNTSLVVKRGGKLIAEGTPCSPIVFTSGRAAGSRASKDWGGIILLGRAVNNIPGGVGFIEGLTANSLSAHGGTDNADNSGILKYVRLEFGGFDFASSNEINGLTLGSIGSGTKIDYIQVSFNNDDGFEWFGGNVNCSHLVSYRNLDDDFDTDNGFSGKVQFCLAVRDPNIADDPGISTSEGFESDNNSSGNTNTPLTSAVFSNVTVVGPYRGSVANVVADGFRRGARLRRNTALSIFNSIFMDYATGLFIDGSAAVTNANNGTLRYRNNIVALSAPSQRVAENADTRTIFFNAAYSNDSLSTTAGVLITPYNFLAPDYRPAASSPALSNINFSDPGLGTVVTPGAITTVPYRGAFAPAPTPMWTDGWANWDPQTTVYPATTVTVSGTISANTTWTRNNVYQLSGLVYVDTLITLTIEPGTIIRGGPTTSNTSLVVKRGGKLIAEGTPCSPIVFTSGRAAGSRASKDWGGIILLGRAVNNIPGGVGFIEGLTANSLSAHGGTDNADNSGILKYVRLEFGGFDFASSNEINGLTLGSIGSGTKIDYIQVSFNNDDGFEWFGGNVNCSHLVSYRNLDDDFDTDNGFSGKVQFCLAVRDPNIADDPGISTSEGFESDNNSSGNTNTPLTSAVFSNVTVVGPYRGSVANVVADGFRRGARLRRNTALSIFNSIFMDYATGLFIDGSAAVTNANNGTLRYRNNIVALSAPSQRVAENADTRTIFFNAAYSNDSLSTTAGVLITPYNFLAPDYRPAPGSPALSNYNFSDPALPVTLTNFHGEVVRNDNVLYWETATEINNAGFEVMKSIDGINFSKIGYVASNANNGNSTQNLNYSYVDNKAAGKLYYKLKQLDKDGRATFSSILMLENLSIAAFKVTAFYPNPVRDNISVSIVSPKKMAATLVVNDMFGRILSQRVISIAQGSNVFQVNVEGLASGNYIMNVVPNDGSLNTIQKFIKQ